MARFFREFFSLHRSCPTRSWNKKTSRKPRRRALLIIVIGAAAAGLIGLGLPLAWMVFGGKTDERQPADAAVIFGAAVWAGDVPSHALRDRVHTGCNLYHEGLVKDLVMSGGPSGGIHEVEAMRKLAIEEGIPADRIHLDYKGINTRESVISTTPIFEELGAARILAVSHFYHLPRIKMTYRKAGLSVHTVPAEERWLLVKLPWYMLREAAALWIYMFWPLG